jgi:hypothetical protein
MKFNHHLSSFIPFIVIRIPQSGPGAGQFMTVLNSVQGQKVVSQGHKQYVIASQGQNQGQQQIILQSSDGQNGQMVNTIGNLTRGGQIVLQNNGNQLISSGQKIYIQQGGAQGPMILVR